MFCKKCGKKIPENSKFCTFCGSTITGKNIDTYRKKNYKGVFILAFIAAFILVYFLSKWILSTLGGATSENKLKNNVSNYFSEETWQSFNSTEGKFKINFPKYPVIGQPQTETIFDTPYISTTYTADSEDGTSYMVIYGYYPEIFPEDFDVKNGLEGSINAMLAGNKSNQLISSNFISLGRHQGIDYIIKNEDESFDAKGRIVVVSEGKNPVKIYILIVTSEINRFNNDDFNKFINSFEILL